MTKVYYVLIFFLFLFHNLVQYNRSHIWETSIDLFEIIQNSTIQFEEHFNSLLLAFFYVNNVFFSQLFNCIQIESQNAY